MEKKEKLECNEAEIIEENAFDVNADLVQNALATAAVAEPGTEAGGYAKWTKA